MSVMTVMSGPTVYKKLVSKLEKRMSSLCSIFIFLCCFTFVAYQSYGCFDKYVKRARSIDVTYVKQTDVEFPSFSLCPEYYDVTSAKSLAGYKSNILQECNKTQENMEMGWYHGSNQCDSSYIFENAHPKLEDFEMSKVEGWFADGVNTFEMSPNDSRLSWRQWYLAGYGKCFTFTISNDVTQAHDGIGELTMYFGSKEFMLYVHSKGNFVGWPEFTVGVKGFKIMPGKYILIEINILEYMEYLDTEDGICNATIDYVQDECLAEVVHDLSLSKIGCQIPYGQYSGPLCKNKSVTSDAFSILGEGMYDEEKCKNQCRFLKGAITSQTITDDEDNKTSIIITFKRQVKKSTSRVSYKELELLAEVGGYVGLFLGLSIFHISMAFTKLLKKILRKP